MKTNKIIYWVATGLLSAQMLFSATMYFFNHDYVKEAFTNFNYPTYIIYPMAILKILGIVAIITKKSTILKEWAYAGFFFEFVLAIAAHLNAGDGQQGGAIVALVLLATSYYFDKKVFGGLATLAG